jgi:hypothetical protein
MKPDAELFAYDVGPSLLRAESTLKSSVKGRQ